MTLATRRSASSSGKARGANVIVTRPRIDAPEPLPARREAVAAVLPASRASCSRGEVRCLPGDEVMVPIMAGGGGRSWCDSPTTRRFLRSPKTG
ncbi:hypothetical protein EZV78_02700 [Cutibacterium avidum]|nr:hypothetical protein EZV78_02700 [Cutibacterium avidum]